MMEDRKFVDYEGLSSYHKTLVKQILDMKYSPTMIFASKLDFVNKTNWKRDEYGYVYGISNGLMVTVDGEIWQLVDEDKFRPFINRVEDVNTKVNNTPESMGWKVISSPTDFTIDEHTLKITKK